jgi:hypothetical protein
MARWQLLGDWPHGAITIPAGTEILGEVGPNGAVTASYNHMALRPPMPLEAKAMDQEAYDAMTRWYSSDLWHRFLHSGDITPRRR